MINNKKLTTICNEQQYEILFITVIDSIMPAGTEQFFSKYRMCRKHNNDAKIFHCCQKTFIPKPNFMSANDT